MVKKIEASDWLIALIHWLIVGVAFQFATAMLIGGIFVLLSLDFTAGVSGMIGVILTGWLGSQVGAMVSVKYLMNKYFIKDKQHIVNVSIGIVIAFNIINILYELLIKNQFDMMGTGSSIVSIGFFYFFSIKYFYKTETGDVANA